MFNLNTKTMTTNEKENRKIANEGNYFYRIKQNIKSGWVYPEAIFCTTAPGGRYGNIETYYYCDGKSISHIATIPTWASKNGKYKFDYERLEKYSSLKCYSLQTFVKLRS